MIEYELGELDLGEVRFAISPLNEVGLALRVFRDPGRYPQHLPWLRMTEAARAELDTEVLVALTNDQLWTPDFLHPLPASPLTRFADELAGVAALPPRLVRAKLLEVHDELPPVLSGRSDRVLRRVVRAVQDFWVGCFEPWWPRMRAVLEADVAHRGRVIAHRGLAAMFEDLSVRMRLVGNVVQVTTSSRLGYRRSTTGVGLTLVPSLFSRGGSTPITPEQPPQVMYAARGIGTLWMADQVAGPAPLADLIGPARSSLLALLDSPASSTELGVRLGVTASAVNQHLRALRAAGLLTSARHGRAVLYLRSELGDRLLRGG
ncbi:helix-turn-helix domain-containing protein [Nocardioides sp. SOB77]|uniref:Helix-turn-helix domain-containing protein n=1 Tax=Nocardioides oceani TaxID=3058369 RepID=A0ABT8FM05_9ACTN|nr:helix-turn-helix domain-containing protein [Nocardioides oceani]MDN4175569.1 helix-turn-helix domain-containing protein [Nocardioides oceani]